MLIKELADELLQAEDSRVGIPPFTERYANLSVEDAYNIQLEVVERKLKNGRYVIGKKVGLTSVAMQQMLGVNEPDYGHLLDDMKIENGSTISISSFVSPKIEAEIGFVLEKDLKGPNITYIDVLMATKYVVPTLEIIDSRISDWKIKLVDTVADNGSSAKVVIGDTFSSIDKVDLRTTGMTLYKNNSLIATGAGAAALGHPAQAIAWLANKLHEFNIELKAGELILPGALSGAVSVNSKDSIQADFGSLGSVSVAFI
ncbi:2-keto-4-pentenoate hydratase [Bacillus cereus group sp. MYBK71-2]|uniref:2-keto-4-pentenoate hydratase n=1 Tax=Bacillus cereus group TaxID=86661 RepID=UPI000CD821DC|nr:MULTISPECIES: 2-keto-4-pentenoate hydratase [Bacillus cereus group]MCC2338048.1 2-keto-4-pentenoate hydratase [Bacillus tropicus]MCU5421337.1 2-keto-4-pentenoate hydratase [Bacillus tropicus]MDA1777705.1 2-keto-4-pentenoate hydratase [Bacillus cereus group sp. BY9-3LC]MDA1797938.1 2-keto-4-pentenoate hydratase [Bacillus cereus group sp. BY6-1LC]